MPGLFARAHRIKTHALHARNKIAPTRQGINVALRGELFVGGIHRDRAHAQMRGELAARGHARVRREHPGSNIRADGLIKLLIEGNAAVRVKRVGDHVTPP